MKEYYLDNAATTQVYPEVADIMREAAILNFGNPSSMHRKGIEAEQYIRKTMEIITKELKVQPKEITFTSGGTESNNMALIGAAFANQRAGKHIITTQFEHPSVHNPLIFLEDFGFRLSFIQVDSFGHIDIEQLLNEICDETIIVSIMYVNNEVGAVQDITAISKAIKARKTDILLHVDAIQAFGKYHIYPAREGIDLMSVSGHKIHGPKGSGFLYIRDRVKVKPIIYGGGHQRNMRSGTENVSAIAGLGLAIERIYRDYDHNRKHLFDLKNYFIERLGEIEAVTINAVPVGGIEQTAPHILSVSFAGVKSEVLLHALEDKFIYVSAGSACASNHPSLSGSLQAIGVKKELLESTLRFSFSELTTYDEIDVAIEALKELLPMLRRFTKQ